MDYLHTPYCKFLLFHLSLTTASFLFFFLTKDPDCELDLSTYLIPECSMARIQRNQSVPPDIANQQTSDLLAPSILKLPASSPCTLSRPPDLTSRIDALSKLQWELNLRAMSIKTTSLEQDLKALIESTQGDKKFRAEYENRLKDLWKEMLAVKSQTAKLETGTDTLKSGLEQFQAQIDETIGQAKKERKELRDTLDGIYVLLEQLPSQEDLDKGPPKGKQQQLSTITDNDTSSLSSLSSQPSLESSIIFQPANSSQGLSTVGSSSQASLESTIAQPASALTPSKRFQQILKSTRRWHRDSKTSLIPRAQFIANYFKKQSKRDARLAVLIQKHVQKKIKWRLREAQARPQNLEEFCMFVEWADVLETVAEFKVDEIEKELSQESISQRSA